ncbi:U-scoloptoxin(01)-Er1a-like [Tachypleus tridentatus]|uniref:U-scoloptoxin(01)-Er1a-like n=1 Tax=Tachypleus tridentatus TaxID=6853 RepID=UPI003FD13393
MWRHISVIALSCLVLVVVCEVSLSRVKRWEEFPDVEFKFDCSNRAVGFYADQDFDCKIFHMCDVYGRRVPYICPNNTMFNQQYRVCDWSYSVDCSQAPKWFYLNELTYERPPPKHV